MKKLRTRIVAAGIALFCMVSILAGCTNTGDEESQAGTNTADPSVSTPVESNGGGEVTESGLTLLQDTYRANSASVKHEAVTACLTADPGALIPIDIQSTGKEVMEEIFERLYVMDGFGGDLLPQLAADMPKEVEGGYEITLREGIYDSKGNSIKASDVVFSYQYLMENSQPENMGQLTENYKDIVAVDEYTVYFPTGELTGVGDMANLFAQQYIWSEQSWYDYGEEEGFSTNPIGSGPYVVSNYVIGSSIELVPSEDHWSEGKDFQLARYCANVEKITYKIVSDSTQSVNSLITGELDYSHNVTTLDVADFQDGGLYGDEFNTFSYLSNMTRYLLPNCDSASVLGDDVNLRLAIMYAVNGAEAMVAGGDTTAQVAYDIFNGKFPEYRDSWYTEDNFYVNPSIETAKSYLEQSNYDNSTLVLLCQSSTVWTSIGSYIIEQLDQIGIKAEMNAVDSALFSDTYNDPSNWDLLLGMMAGDNYGIVELDRMMCKDSYVSPRETLNFIVDDTLQELIALCKTAEGHADDSNTQALHDYIIENAYGRGLYAATTTFVVRNTITELAVNYKYYGMPGGCVYADNVF